MSAKIITHKDDMYAHIKEGIDSVASIVGRTLGPGGLPILIERQGHTTNGEPLGPMITKDGVTVAGECASENPKVDVVIQAVKDICRKTNKVAGDGTTTAIVLGKAILDETLRVVKEKGLNPQEVRTSVEEALDDVIRGLSKETSECKSFDMIEQVATISANGDREIGSIIRRAFEAVGTEGIITVDEGGTKQHTLEIVDGFQIKRGAEAQDRFFNNQDATRFEAENAHVILYDGKLTSPVHVLETLKIIWEKYQGKMPPVVFMANEFSMDVIQVMLINKQQTGLSICPIRTPHQTKVTTVMLDDMAVFLGGERLGNGNRNLNNLEFDDIGICEKVVIDKYTATFFGGNGAEDSVLQRIEQLKAQREHAESPYDAALVSDRIAALAEGIAKIGVGGSTDLEVKEKYHRIEDAVNAARAAISEGVIPGGGASLYRLSEALSGNTVGALVLKSALKAPLKQIIQNVGLALEKKDSWYKRLLRLCRVLPSLKVDFPESEILSNSETTFDAVNLQTVKALHAGIIDPVKVTKAALLSACSISALLSTCGGAITFSRK